MEATEQTFPWLELLDRPAFCVKDEIVTMSNTAAKNRTISVGMHIRGIVTENWDTYARFSGGCLLLPVIVCDQHYNATVYRNADYDLFMLEQPADTAYLQSLALAAQQLRIPLSNVMAIADNLLSDAERLNGEAQHQASQLQRGLFQLLRIITNMSDTNSYREVSITGMEMTNITAVFNETVEKAQAISEGAGIKITYNCPNEVILGLANAEKLERAAYNMLSNALKFAPANSTIEAKLSCNSKQVSFSVCNDCENPVQEYQFQARYQREPSIEDNRHGLGLGMTIIGAVASAHGGTVLIDHPDRKKTRVTMTIAIQKATGSTLRSPVMRISDYAGGRDKALLEFADLLPTDAYDNI